MTNLKTKYMGIELENPIIQGASDMSKDLDKLKKAEEPGAAAIVWSTFIVYFFLNFYHLQYVNRINSYGFMDNNKKLKRWKKYLTKQ